MDFEEKK